jgi:hypothetical protein
MMLMRIVFLMRLDGDVERLMRREIKRSDCRVSSRA